MKRALAIAALLAATSCGRTGIVTGGTLRECGSFNREQMDFLNLGIELIVCPRLEEYFTERPCTANALTELLHEITLYFYAQGEDYCVFFEKPED